MHSAIEDLDLDRITIVYPGDGACPLTERIRVADLGHLARRRRPGERSAASGGLAPGAGGAPRYTRRVTRIYVAVVVVEVAVLAALWLLSRHFAA